MVVCEFHAHASFSRWFMRTIVIRARTPREIVIDCAYTMCFLVYWRRDVVQRPDVVNLKANMLTSQTYQDMLSLCRSVILAVQIYALKYPNMLFDSSRMSSRFSEHTFQMLRSATKNGNKSLCNAVHEVSEIILKAAGDGD